MFECLILGDSIGVGMAQAINARRALHCDVMAVERASAEQILAWRKPAKNYGMTIMAIGSNDPPRRTLQRGLAEIRRRISTRRVIWLLPYSRPTAYAVTSVALIFGDETLDLGRFPTRDRVHPLRYGDVASALLK
ncbi:hypothetical protein J2X47_003786 [Sphingomonas sp. BE270]|jgi:hypothetical protein|uniref:SGNH hydrolase-type esterase domain-containing protein n=1 Tax=Sphingomonas echinoides TaxID=59803 RepID=A0ABU4PFW8_9SPHN|nr:MULTISPECIES: hypothetical protein [Sphingomonas]MDR7259582.1 hypothetical protein [Sphingomonas sp. BE270]MDX5983096.1 hypothetical protein [Sphingomonas echinoides]